MHAEIHVFANKTATREFTVSLLIQRIGTQYKFLRYKMYDQVVVNYIITANLEQLKRDNSFEYLHY